MIQHGYINQWMINHDGSLLLATFIWVNSNIIIYYILYQYIPKFCTIATKWRLQNKVHAKNSKSWKNKLVRLVRKLAIIIDRFHNGYV